MVERGLIAGGLWAIHIGCARMVVFLHSAIPKNGLTLLYLTSTDRFGTSVTKLFATLWKSSDSGGDPKNSFKRQVAELQGS